MASILVVEDTLSLQALYRGMLTRAGHQVTVASSAAAARDIFLNLAPQVVCLDLSLPDGDGLDLMRSLMAGDHRAHFIVITSDGSVHRAVELMRAGASEFLVKPFDETRLLAAITQALQTMPGLREMPADQALPAPNSEFIGSSRAMHRIYETIAAVSRSMATVFITGESGTGKEICAQAVHASSPRAGSPFVPLNCGAIPPDRLDIEVFGHLEGALPGAIGAKRGAIAHAHGGTLFLDEIAEMDLNLQTKLQRFLQTSMIQPIGSPLPSKVDVRIIAATNRDPIELVQQGRLREDLYYRLHVVPIHLPPLRDRNGDVIEIAEAMLARYSREEGRRFIGLAEEVKGIFCRYHWPGNVRELRNVLWNVVLLNEGPLVTAEMLPRGLVDRDAGPMRDQPRHKPNPHVLDGLTLAEAERLVIERAIDRAEGSVPRAARALEVSPSTIYRKRAAWMQDGQG